MSSKSNSQFHQRRAAEERTSTNQATDALQAIPHGELSKLHADETQADGGASPPRATALDITAVDGNVTITSAAAEVTSLTPDAAMETSDRLLATARKAGQQRWSASRQSSGGDPALPGSASASASGVIGSVESVSSRKSL